MTKLSVIIVTKNEAHNIIDCLKSVEFADEIIVFDSSSTDNTVALCRQITPLVTVTPDWPGDGPQKNRALAQATGDWILCLDADERVSPELAREIQKIIQQTSHSAFSLPFQSFYCHHPIRFGDWRGESHIRLFKKDKAAFTNDIVHCHLKVNGTIGRLQGKVTHFPFRDLAFMLDKMNTYSSKSAETLFEKGRKANLGTALSHAFWTFCRGYFLKLGFLDGKAGFLLAMSNTQGTYYRYVKLMMLWESHATDLRVDVPSDL